MSQRKTKRREYGERLCREEGFDSWQGNESGMRVIRMHYRHIWNCERRDLVNKKVKKERKGEGRGESVLDVAQLVACLSSFESQCHSL